MSKCIRHEACPECRKRGRDTRGDNLGVYSDGSSHCFSCGYRVPAKRPLKFLNEAPANGNENKAVLPPDFSREVPANAWKWLLQYGLSYTYWHPYVGWSEKHHRLIFTVETPIKLSVGRLIEKEDDGGKSGPKWLLYGNRRGHVPVLGRLHVQKSHPIVLVEDIISAHKVSHITPVIPLFGSSISDEVVAALVKHDRPVVLWLDEDQRETLPRKVGKLQTFLKHKASWMYTPKDPKEYDLPTIERMLKEYL